MLDIVTAMQLADQVINIWLGPLGILAYTAFGEKLPDPSINYEISFLLDKIILSLLIPPYSGQEVPANYMLVR